ncbi:tetratricopeptide repeat protein [bacterium]|nr:tetratricopeptide repeat protein [bacterium]
MTRRILFSLILPVILLTAGCVNIAPKLGTGRAEVERFERAVDVNPANEHAWFLLGKRFLQGEDFSNAENAFEHAIDLRPDFSEAYVGIGVSRLQREDWRGAADAYERLLAIEPQSVAAYEGLAAAHLGAKDIDDAEAAALEALKIYDGALQAHRILGEVYYIRGNYAGAVEQWNISLEEGERASDLQPLVDDLTHYMRKYGAD